ncbi:MAG: hypothetical protein F2817_04235 [Actinobacteria bacterium]|nr:hypothetical protein [Actinomycetota bacterium]
MTSNLQLVMHSTDPSPPENVPVWVDPVSVPTARRGRRSRYEQQLTHLEQQPTSDDRWLAVVSNVETRKAAKRHTHALRQAARARGLRLTTQIREDDTTLTVLARRKPD